MVIEPKEMAMLVQRWGHRRLEATLIHIAQATDHKGLPIVLDPTAEHVEKVMMAIYAHEHVAVEDVAIVGSFG